MSDTKNVIDSGYMKEEQAAEYLGFSVVTLRQWRWQEKGPVYIKISGKVRYAREDLDMFAKGRRVVPQFSKEVA